MLTISEGFPEFAWPIAWSWIEGRTGVFDDFGPKSDLEFVERYISIYQNGKTFGIWENGRIGGVIGFEWNSPTCVTAHILVSRRFWGKKYSESFTEAARLMFASAPELLRIQAFVPASNRLAVSLAKRMGARSEGLLRDATMQGGQAVDVELLGLTRRDFEEAKNGTELRRVEPAIVGEHGEQRDELERVLFGSIDASADVDERILKHHSGDDDRDAHSEHSGGGDRERGRDQQNGHVDTEQDSAVPRVARVRGKRSIRPSGTIRATPKLRKSGRK